MELRESIDAILAEGNTLTDRVYEMLCESLTLPRRFVETVSRPFCAGQWRD